MFYPKSYVNSYHKYPVLLSPDNVEGFSRISFKETGVFFNTEAYFLLSLYKLSRLVAKYSFKALEKSQFVQSMSCLPAWFILTIPDLED